MKGRLRLLTDPLEWAILALTVLATEVASTAIHRTLVDVFFTWSMPQRVGVTLLTVVSVAVCLFLFLVRRRGVFVDWKRSPGDVAVAGWAFGAAVAAFGLGETFYSALTGIPVPGGLGLGALYLAAFALCAARLFRYHKTHIPTPRTRRFVDEPPEPRRHLVLFLSDLPDDGTTDKETGWPKDLPRSEHPTIEDDLPRLEKWKECHPGWKWEMPLRGIRPHLANHVLDRVTLVCSSQSLAQAPRFRNYLETLPELHGVDIFVWAHPPGLPSIPSPATTRGVEGLLGFDFEKFNEVSDAVVGLVEQLEKSASEHDIMIDITGGQKPNSVVAAAVTFGRHIKVQYAQTRNPWDVKSYDVVAGHDVGMEG
jgi:hypothetical protein